MVVAIVVVVGDQCGLPGQAHRHPQGSDQRPQPQEPVGEVEHVTQPGERRLLGQLG